MHVRIVRLQPKNPLVVIGLLALVLAVLLLVLSAAVAAAAGVALLGGVCMAVRRLRGGLGRLHGEPPVSIGRLDPAQEISVHPAADVPRLPPESRGH